MLTLAQDAGPTPSSTSTRISFGLRRLTLPQPPDLPAPRKHLNPRHLNRRPGLSSSSGCRATAMSRFDDHDYGCKDKSNVIIVRGMATAIACMKAALGGEYLKPGRKCREVSPQRDIGKDTIDAFNRLLDILRAWPST